MTRLDVPARPGALAPEVFASSKGVLLSWLEPVPGQRRHHALRYARLGTDGWSKARTIHSGSGFFANWADFPAIVESSDGTLWAHRLQRSGGGTYAYDVCLSRSENGTTWQDAGRLHTDKTPTEHGFVTFLPEQEGVRAFWLDGRALKGMSGMRLYTCRLGASAGTEVVLDDDVCTCCQTSAALTSSGPLVVYRDHEKGEVRDISFVRRTKGGWSKPATVHRDGWRIAACPVNGPAIDSAKGLVAVAWYTGANDKGRVQVAFSTNDGSSFEPPVVVDDASPLGRVDIVCTDDAAIVCWLARRGEAALVLLARVTPLKGVGKPVELARIPASRASGFPRMTRSGQELVIVWRETGRKARLHSAKIAVQQVPGVE